LTLDCGSSNSYWRKSIEKRAANRREAHAGSTMVTGIFYNGMTILRKACLLVLSALALALLGCNEPAPGPAGNAASPPKTNEFETGRFALQKMLATAHLWSADAAPVQLSSAATSESNGHDGKSGTWRAVFASRGRQKSEPFIWSGMADAPRKLDHGVEDVFNPANRSTQPWDLNYLKVDTDQAFTTAQQHGGKQLLEKDPKTQITYLLDFDPLSNQLRWHVIYASESSGKLTVLVDASTGAFLRKD
jgi:hypothetical protein